jgi:CBS domain-containing protein
MKSNVKTVVPGTTLKEAAALMFENKIGSVIIIDKDNKPTGIITKRDIVRHFISGDIVDPNIAVGEYFKTTDTKLVTLDTNATFEDVNKAIESIGKHHITIINSDGTLAGVISSLDIINMQIRIAKAFPYFIK